MGYKNLDNVATVDFNTNPTVGPYTEGKLYYDAIWKTLSLNAGRDVTLQIGQEEVVRIYNATGATILNGQAVYANGVYSGGSNDVLTVALAQSNSDATAFVIGCATQDIPTSDYGFVTVRGNINNLNTVAIGGAYLATQNLLLVVKVGGVAGDAYTFEVVDTGTGGLRYTEVENGAIVLNLGGTTPTVADVVTEINTTHPSAYITATAEGSGNVIVAGVLAFSHGFDTAVGDTLYLSAVVPGKLINQIPDAPNLEIKVGQLITKSATVGRVNIRIAQAYRLGDLSDVTTTNPVTDEILRYNGSEWVNGAEAAVSAGKGVEFYLDGTEIINGFLGSVTTVTLTAGGSGYAVGDVLTITTGGTGATLRVLTVSGSAVATFEIITKGSGYTTGTPKATTCVPSTGRSGCTVNITAVNVDNQNNVETMSKSPWNHEEDVEGTAVSSNTVLSDIYLYNTAIGRTSLTAGTWTFLTYAGVSATTGVSTILGNMMRVRPGAGTLTTSGSGTTRTAIASEGTPFALNTELDIGTIETGTISAAGTGYHVGDTVTVTEAGASGGTFQVSSITTSTGAITGITLLTKGAGYSTGAKATTVSPTGGINAQINVTTINAIDSISYIQTPKGVYPVASRVSDTQITITTPTNYNNENAVSFSTHKKLFQIATTEINNTVTAPLYTALQLYNSTSVQPAITVQATDKMAAYRFSRNPTASVTIYFAYGGTTRYSHIESPLATLHGNLAGLQGGTGTVPAEEYYHVNSAQYTTLTGIAGLAKTDSNFMVGDGSAWASESASTARTSIGLGSVENTALSTWAGTTNITTFADNAVTTARILANNVTEPKIADDAIITRHILANNVTTAKIAFNNVTADQIADNAVTTRHILDNNVTDTKIADNSVITRHLLDNNVTESKIADNAITSRQISTNAISSNVVVNGSTISGAYVTNALDTLVAGVNSFTLTGGISADVDLLDVVPSSHICTYIVVKNTTANVVVLNIGLTDPGTEIASFSLDANGLFTVVVNEMFSTTAATSMYVTSLDWNSAEIDVSVNHLKGM